MLKLLIRLPDQIFVWLWYIKSPNIGVGDPHSGSCLNLNESRLGRPFPFNVCVAQTEFIAKKKVEKIVLVLSI
jgi:hypothetical protein